MSGYLILLLRKLCDKLPDALEKIAPVLIYPVAGILGIGLLMNFAIEPVMGAINTALNNGLTGMGGSSKLVLGLILGGMMAIDMGGPFNKAAYVFGTAAIAAGNYDIMAAVMIGGMTPPCAIALATLLFKDKFTKSEEKQDRQTSLWDSHLLPKERFHMRQQIRFTYCRPALSVLRQPEHCLWHLDVH